MPTCRGCHVEIQWGKMPTGAMNPLNLDRVAPDVGQGVVAYNPKRGTATMVTAENIMECAKWAELGVTFHTSHFATCPEREQFRQESLL